MEVLKNVNVSLNLNLREPKKMSGTTNVYAVVKIDGKQMKMPLCINVYPWTWDKRKQEVKVSPTMSEEERAKNIWINEKIWDVKKKYMQIISYLCMVDDVNADMVENVMKEEFKEFKNNTDMANKNPIIPKRSVTATRLINEGFSLLYGETIEKRKCAEGTYKNMQISKNAFINYVKDTEGVYDSVSTLSQKGINAYKSYLEKKAEEEQKGRANNIANCCNVIIRIINELARTDKYDKYGLKELKCFSNRTIEDKEEKKRRALSDKEVNAVMVCNTLTDEEKIYREIFTMQLESGVRFSDLNKLFNNDYSVEFSDGVKTEVVKTQKEGITAVIVVNDTIAKLQQKYINGLPFALKETKYNKTLKSIFEKSGMTQTHIYISDIAGRKIEKEERLCDIITNHFARHTFITNKVREGWNCDYLCYATGHADDEMIRKVYAHITQNDKVQKVVKEYKRINQTNRNIEENNKNQKNGNDEIKEKKEKEIYDIIGKRFAEPKFKNMVEDIESFPNRKERNLIAHGASILDVLNERLNALNMIADENYNISFK